jgi:ferrous iron transport protein A
MTFVGGNADIDERSMFHRDSTMSSSTNSPKLPLSMTAVGDRVWIVEIKGGHRMVRRLTDVGIVQGSEVTIVSRTESGSVIVAFQGCRIGVGAGMAHRVLVTTMNDEGFPMETQAQSTQSVTKQSVTKQSVTKQSVTKQPVTGDSTMQTVLHLGALDVGQSGRVLGYEKGNRAYREKLLSMGLTPGTHFTVTRQAPMGDPIEIEVRGFKLSLRKGEVAALHVEVTHVEDIQSQEVSHE